MLPQRESLPTVTAAGVVAVIFACLGILGCGLVMLSVLVLPHLPSEPNAPPIPAESRALVIGIYGFFFAVCIGELVAAINIFRRRNWARIAILVWAGLMTLFSFFGAVAIFFVFSISNTALPNIENPGPFLMFMKVFMFLIYGVPFAVGVWWLILFTRPRVTAAFQNPLVYATVSLPMDPSGFPAPHSALPIAAPKKPSCPLPIAVIAAFDVSGAVWMILFLFIPLPFLPPFFLFGMQISQAPYKALLAVLGISYIIFVVGIFRLKRWGLDSLLTVKSLFLLNGIVTLLNPKFMAAMNDMMVRIAAKNPALPTGQPILPNRFMEAILGFSYAFGLALVIIMLVYRGRFLKAAAEAGR